MPGSNQHVFRFDVPEDSADPVVDARILADESLGSIGWEVVDVVGSDIKTVKAVTLTVTKRRKE